MARVPAARLVGRVDHAIIRGVGLPDQPLNPLTSRACFLTPRRVTPGLAWHEHIPFGMFLVELLRPRAVVELGTHYGDSYCAFCQAVAELGLDTRCYAVDTWTGDSQTGFYQSHVLADLRAHHDPLYGAFSRLIQSTFDQAVDYFADGSIDLLHIDGYHSYEAVKHDVETWLPKLSPAGVALLHDINVRERGFGVWQVWQELRARHPHFEFVHGHGLGVLAPGGEPPAALRPLLQASEADVARLRRFFFELGRRFTLEAELTGLRRERDRWIEEAAHFKAKLQMEYAKTEHFARAVTRTEASYRALEKTYLTLFAHAARIDAHPVWRAYQSLRLRAVPRGSRRERALRGLKDGLGRLRRGQGEPPAETPPPAAEPPRPYDRWLERHAVTAEDLARLRAETGRLAAPPTISVVMPVHDVDEAWLREAIESVRGQAYERWDLCLVNDASTAPHIRPVLEEYAAGDPRIRVEHLTENRGIAGASNRGLELATGDFVGFLDHDDVLYPYALAEVALALARDPDVDIVYSDEDKIDADGRRVEPFFKPDWSPDLLLALNYTCHFSVYRRSLVESVGGLRPGFEGSQDYDLVLRASEVTSRIVHLPAVLYGWRQVPASTAASVEAKPYAHQGGRAAIADALARRGVEATVEMFWPGRYHVRYPVRGHPLVSLVIPMRDRAELTRQCVASIESRSSYKNVEIVIVDNASLEPDSRRFFEEASLRHRVVALDQPFNYSAINNFGARRATGEYVLFLNNDTEVDAPDWIEAMLEHAQRPEVGAVGAKLLYPDRRIQHAGVFVMGSELAFAGHAFKYLPEYTDAHFGLAQVVRNVSAVTGACMMVRRQVFEQVGGFDESVRVAFNDVDLCLRLREAGYLIIYTPLAVLVHHESATRKAMHPPDDDRLIRERWQHVVSRGDPYYNPNLSRTREDFALDV
jgi:GT2 family glycosyltransferase